MCLTQKSRHNNLIIDIRPHQIIYMVDGFAACEYSKMINLYIFKNKVAPAPESADRQKYFTISWNSGTIWSTETANHFYESLEQKNYNEIGGILLKQWQVGENFVIA